MPMVAGLERSFSHDPDSFVPSGRHRPLSKASGFSSNDAGCELSEGDFSEDEEDEMPIYPLSLDDVVYFSRSLNHLSQVTDADVAAAGRRISHRTYSEGANLIRRKQGFYQAQRKFNKPVVARWRSVVQRAMSMDDPWSKFQICDSPTEECVRHRYSSIRKSWVTDCVFVKVQPEPFARGAMRECFRLKKLSKFASREEWQQAHNYVAKRYISDVPRETLFEDVRLQMDAKLWAEEYSRHNPPKKIDIFQLSILEFVQREGNPIFHLEHFIDGKYIKYNSNSGFVSEAWRQTPQAFSHFTFERSGHNLIVVDIQGVGDLYTDPQIHTVDGKGYGDGNLGTKGMALFFHSHTCNSICTGMGLTPFDLAPTERRGIKKLQGSARTISETVCRGSEELCFSPTLKHSSVDIMEYIRQRSVSIGSAGRENYINSVSSMDSGDNIDEGLKNSMTNVHGCYLSTEVIPEDDSTFPDENDSGIVHVGTLPPRRRDRFSSETDSYTGGGIGVHEAEREAFWAEARKASRPAGYINEENYRALESLRQHEQERQSNDTSVLGQVHLDMVRYHELGRFSGEESHSYDRAAAWFHLELAADCGLTEAILTAAKIYLNMPHDLLADFEVEDDENNVDQGLDLMERAAQNGDRDAILYMANVYETGERCGTERKKDWTKAVIFYKKAAESVDSEDDKEPTSSLSTPKHQIYAKIAELYQTGGFGLSGDLQKAGDLYNLAAECATEAMKGKLATKFYMLAEECYGDVEE